MNNKQKWEQQSGRKSVLSETLWEQDPERCALIEEGPSESERQQISEYEAKLAYYGIYENANGGYSYEDMTKLMNLNDLNTAIMNNAPQEEIDRLQAIVDAM